MTMTRSTSRCARTTTRTRRPHPLDQPGPLASYVYLSISYYFDFNDVALRNFANYFLHRSHEEKEHAEKRMKLQNQQDGPIFLQNIKQPDRDDWENGLNAMGCALHLEKSVNQSLLDLYKLATDKNDPYLCDFIETHYLNEQVKSIQELGDHITNLHRIIHVLAVHMVTENRHYISKKLEEASYVTFKFYPMRLK